MDVLKAIRKNDIKKLEKLLKKGFKPNSVLDEFDGNNQLKYSTIPLSLAAKEGYTDIVSLLVKYGANLHASNDDWEAPMHIAAFYGHVDVMRFLLTRDININKQDKKGNTVLHVAVMKSQFNIVNLLLTNDTGIDINIKNIESKTALDIAKKERVCHIIDLIEEKIKQDMVNKNKDSAVVNPAPAFNSVIKVVPAFQTMKPQNKSFFESDVIIKEQEKQQLVRALSEIEKKEQSEKEKIKDLQAIDSLLDSLQCFDNNN
ncbi:poly [ADP-ribose] polymerase tankyrase [Hydra vulgaris]|uniref:Poly [ADP-ribose] polymerase tankyrase n=1 Tax=Hydra vulgaris TaxID=6087 RepID=A0ABM4BDZ1_HYDVU